MALAFPPLNCKPHRQWQCCSSSSSSSSTTSHRRPAVILPGLGNNTGDYKKLELTLQEYGVPTVVAKVSRIDWLRNAAGLVDPNYWKGTLQPTPVLDWYLKRVDDAVQEAKELAQGAKPCLYFAVTVLLLGVNEYPSDMDMFNFSMYLEEGGSSKTMSLYLCPYMHLARYWK